MAGKNFVRTTMTTTKTSRVRCMNRPFDSYQQPVLMISAIPNTPDHAPARTADKDLLRAYDESLSSILRREAWDRYEARMWIKAMTESFRSNGPHLDLHNLDANERSIILRYRAYLGSKGLGIS